jgi:hypothetical protein
VRSSRWKTALLLLPPLAAQRGEPPAGAAPAPGGIAFEEVALRVGLEYRGYSWGAAWGDLDGDGWQDLWCTNHGEPTALYWNREGTFRRQELPRNPGDDHGAAWADFDRDGDEDVLEMTGANRGHGSSQGSLFVNGERTLVDRAREHGLGASEMRARMPFWIDWNRDGELDLLVTCARRGDEASQLLLQREGLFTPAAQVFLGREQALFAQCTSLAGLGAPHLFVHGDTHPQVVYDLSTGVPRDVTDSLGLPRLGAVQDVACGDFDGDGATDFFLARGFLGCELLEASESLLYARMVLLDGARWVSFTCPGAVTIAAHPTMEDWWQPSGVFVGAGKRHPSGIPFRVEPAEAAGTWGPALAQGEAKGLFVLCEPSSGRWSVYLHGAPHEQVTLEIRADAAPLRDVAPGGFEASRRPPPPALLLREEGGYVNAAASAGIETTNSLGVAAADLDNDMDLDLYVLCGSPLRNLPNVLYENLGQGSFRAVPGAGGAAGTSLGLADGVAVADYDRDGFLDLLVTNGREIGPLNQGPTQLFRNLGNGNHWLRVRLEGRENLEPIGATVRVEAGGREQHRTLGSHVHRGAQDERVLHFGLGPHERASRVTVRWPDGRLTSVADVPADQVLEFSE